MDITGSQGGAPAERRSATTASGVGPAAATPPQSHLAVSAAADEPMARGSSAGAAAPAGGHPSAAATGATLQLGSEAVRPRDAEAAAAAGEQPPAAATEGDLELGADALHDASFGGTSLAGRLPDAELLPLMADYDSIMAASPAAVAGLQEPGAQVAQPRAPQADIAMLGPEVEPPYPLPMQAAEPAAGQWWDLPGDPDLVLPSDALEFAAMASQPSGAMVTEPMEVDSRASELDAAMMPGESTPVLSCCRCYSLSVGDAPPVEVPCCQQLRPQSRAFPLQAS